VCVCVCLSHARRGWVLRGFGAFEPGAAFVRERERVNERVCVCVRARVCVRACVRACMCVLLRGFGALKPGAAECNGFRLSAANPSRLAVRAVTSRFSFL
jgi:hypothetical protein